MDKIGIALMAKIKQILSSEVIGANNYLSFNYPALPFKREDFDYDTTSGMASGEDIHQAAGISEIVNSIPEKQLFWQSRDRLLWDVYDDVLHRTKIAQTQVSAQEEQKIAAAQATLDAHYADFSNYQQIFTNLKMQLNSQEALLTDSKNNLNDANSGVSASDIAQLEIEVEQLKSQVQQAKNDWLVLGKKIAIEQALFIIGQQNNSNINTVWQEAKSKFVAQTDPVSGQDFYPTFFYPADFHKTQTAGWQPVKLGKVEFKRLLDYARSEMGLNASGVDELEVEKLSFEVAQVKIQRNWLDADILTSPFWKWAQGGQPPLSDGTSQPNGSLPAYPTALLFIRNVDILLKKDSSTNDNLLGKIKDLKLPIQIGPLIFNQININRPTRKQPALHLSNQLKMSQVRTARTTILRANATTLAPSTANPILVNPQIGTLFQNTTSPVVTTSTINTQPTVSTLNPSILRPNVSILNSNVLRPSTGMVNTNILHSNVTRPSIGQQVNVGRVTAFTGRSGNNSTAENDIEKDYAFQLLGFICKTMPQSPNPDLTLEYM